MQAWLKGPTKALLHHDGDHQLRLLTDGTPQWHPAPRPACGGQQGQTAWQPGWAETPTDTWKSADAVCMV